MNPVAPIYVGQLQNGVIWIRVEGKGSFKNSSELKEFASIVINKGAKEFVIVNCQYIYILNRCWTTFDSDKRKELLGPERMSRLMCSQGKANENIRCKFMKFSLMFSE